MPRILVELNDDEWKLLVIEARLDRRTPQAQAAHMLAALLERAHQDAAADLLAEPQRYAGGVAGLPPGEQVDPVEGHRDGAAAGVHEVVVPGAGEAQ